MHPLDGPQLTAGHSFSHYQSSLLLLIFDIWDKLPQTILTAQKKKETPKVNSHKTDRKQQISYITEAGASKMFGFFCLINDLNYLLIELNGSFFLNLLEAADKTSLDCRSTCPLVLEFRTVLHGVLLEQIECSCCCVVTGLEMFKFPMIQSTSGTSSHPCWWLTHIINTEKKCRALVDVARSLSLLCLVWAKTKTLRFNHPAV